MTTSSIIVTHTLNDGYLIDTREESGIMTRGMIRNRAVALAVMNGRLPHEVSKADWEEAKLGHAADQSTKVGDPLWHANGKRR